MDKFIFDLPKADLHCHLLGTVQPETFADLAKREGLSLPAAPEEIYASINSFPPDPQLYRHTRVPMPQGHSSDEPEVSYSLFQVSEWVRSALRTAEDLTRITYEAFKNAHACGTSHLEVSFDKLPPQFADLGYSAWVEAHVAGIRMAEKEFGMTGKLIAAIDRSHSGQEADEWIELVTANPHPYVAGIGLDNLENSGPPERFEAAYARAKAAGLHRTAHTSEHVPAAQNAITCIDLLECERLDHGYFVLEDDAVVDRLRDEHVPFTVSSTTSRRSWRPWRKASILQMNERGLNVFPCSDDPAMFPTTLQREYEILHASGVDYSRLAQMARASVEASWLDEAAKASALAELDDVVARSGVAS